MSEVRVGDTVGRYVVTAINCTTGEITTGPQAPVDRYRKTLKTIAGNYGCFPLSVIEKLARETLAE